MTTMQAGDDSPRRNHSPHESPETRTQAVNGTTEQTDEEEQVTPPRVAQGVHKRLLMAPSDTESEKQVTPRRRGRPPKNKNKGKVSPPTAEKAKAKAVRQQQSVSISDRDEDGEYVRVEVGDCVLLDSGDPENHFIALVSSVQLTQDKITSFTAQWYYKPDDVREEVLTSIPGGVLDDEVFLSPHKDRNFIDAVVGICNIVPPEEYNEVQTAIKRGFREKSQKPYFVCRFKYYPNRSLKKALEPLKEEDIRAGLGPAKPKVGDEFQATIPELQEKPERLPEDLVPWRHSSAVHRVGLATQVWSRYVVPSQEVLFRQFRELVDTMRFAVGNVVKIYRKNARSIGHVRCLVLKFQSSDAIHVCSSTGEVRAVLKGEISSSFTEDVALQIFYRTRFNLAHAAHECTKEVIQKQHLERDAFKQEVFIFAQVAAQEKARQEAADEAAKRKRRK
ncbi:hypothetical protein Poli38472_004215 [Pythium oligandrum]|uniref:BAH domain-containing protein n=1 Tax=Pythium oligandrum TaxID=41045 RepID=A0A8K1FJV2_PYTOL|nr:hypothetical protein Poli38472_004215 [Pythium oligandrum]|eukprot:TMW66450.1 hypothetical protein Poli38472_004215 [Pythium oligandrum]